MRTTDCTRYLTQIGLKLGYRVQQTARGHLKFLHPVTGAIVVTSSRGTARAIQNDESRLRRMAVCRD